MPNSLYMRDFLTFKVAETDPDKRYLHECKDSTSESGYSLLVHVDATHSGIVNGNARFYRPDLMANSAHTWGGTKWSKRPVLAHHDEDSDPLGRVATWKYVDLRHEYLGKYSQINNLHFFDSVSPKRMDLFKSVNWVYDHLQKKNKDYVGLGTIQLGLNVTNPEAIGKVQRGEYATVSVGFNTDSAVCSICHQDWAEDGRCEHRLMSVVDGQRCFLISGNQDFRELSFVTFPADKAGIVLNQEVVEQAKDSMAMRVFFLGHSFEKVSGLYQADSLVGDMVESDIRVADDEEEDNEMDLDALRAEISSPDLTQTRALELRKELEGQKDAKRLLSSLNAKIRKNSWDVDAAASVPTKEEVEVKIAALADLKQAMPEEEFTAHLAIVKAEADAHGLVLPALEDGAENKESVPVTDSEAGKSFASLIDDVRTAYAKVPEDEKYSARQLMYQLWDILGDEDMLAWYKSRLSAKEDAADAIVAKTELDSLHDGIEAFEVERKSLQDSLTAARDTNKSLVAQLKRNMATTIVMYSVFGQEKGFTGLDAAAIDARIEERAQRQLVSLQDSLRDLREKLQFTAVEATDATASEDAQTTETGTDQSGEAATAREVEDTATVQDTDQPQNESDSAAESQEEPAKQVRLFATLDDIRALNKRYAVDRYRALKDKAETKDESK